MEDLSTLQQDMEESQKAFEEQFDVNSVTYHKGNTTLVPLGGERVPVTMQTVYPENIQNIQEYINQKPEKDIDYGEEYNKSVIQRQGFIDLKKNLTTMTKILESMVRHKEDYIFASSKTTEKNEHHLQTFQKSIQIDGKQLKDIQQILLSQIQIIETTEFKDRYEGIRNMLTEAESFYDNNKNKQQLGEYFLNMKKFGQNSFSDASKFLDKIKKIKKNFTNQNQGQGENQQQVNLQQQNNQGQQQQQQQQEEQEEKKC